MGITIVQDQPLIGFDDRLAALDGADLDEAAERLRQHAEATGLPAPAARGLLDPYRRMVERIRARRVVEDLGEHPAQVQWLELHVPPGGDGRLALRDEQGSESGVQLSVVGLGYGNGRSAKLSVSEDFGTRERCFALIQHVAVHAVRYADGGSRADVTGLRQLEVAPWETCPRCGQPSADVDPLEYELAGTGIDLSHDDKGSERSVVHELTGTGERKLGLTIPLPAGGPALTVSFSATTSLALVCDAHYRFAAGRHYTPVRPVDGPPGLPFWALGPWP